MFGIIGMVVMGILEFALQPGSPWVEMIAFCFGAGAALTLDEFALVLHLEDVYWTGEGRKSIDAIILGVTFMTLLLTGLLPRTFNELGDYITLSRWVLSVLIVVGAIFVVVCYLKGKLFTGTVGIFVPPVALVGALRLAKPGSPWARRRYAGNAQTMERARRRDESFHQLWERRKHAVWDVIGGKPHLSLPRRGASTATTATTARTATRASRTSRRGGAGRVRRPVLPRRRRPPRRLPARPARAGCRRRTW